MSKHLEQNLDAQQRDEAALAAAQQVARDILRPQADTLDVTGEFPAAQLAALAAAGLKGMAIPQNAGGLALSYRAQAQVFTTLAEGCLATALVLSQHQGCTTLVQASPHTASKERWLPLLASGAAHSTNGFNFLNLPPERAPMRAVAVEGGYRLQGTLPWVTAAHASDMLAAGAILPDDSQLIVALPLRAARQRDESTLQIDPPLQLAALTASHTTSVHCHDYFVATSDVLLGPGPDLLKMTHRGATSYVPTALTLGHARSSLAIIASVAAQRGGTAITMADWVQAECAHLEQDMLLAIAEVDFAQATALRGRGNALAARAAHLALIAGGGTGYRHAHTPQRLYREAGFFSVWSASGGIIPATLAHLLP